MNGSANERLLQLAALRASARPFFLASTLLEYLRLSGTEVSECARDLGCDESTLWRLALCRKPSETNFRSDIEQISAAFGISAPRLAGVLRLVEATRALGHENRGQRRESIVRAARDLRRSEDNPDADPR